MKEKFITEKEFKESYDIKDMSEISEDEYMSMLNDTEIVVE